MPVDWNTYPPDWSRLSLEIRSACDWQCQQCNRQCRRPGEPFDTHRRTLTVAHWWHETQASEVFVVALCAPCHLRHDAEHHRRNRQRSRWQRQHLAGQLGLILPDGE